MLYHLHGPSRLGLRSGQRCLTTIRPISALVQPWLYKLIDKFHPPTSAAHLNEEPLDGYIKGGYHPVLIGDTFQNSRYTVVRKLGWGQYATVWLARDELLDRHVALKILTEQVGTGEHRMDEVPILQKINQSDDTHPGKAHILRMLDHFTHRGPNGLHSCLTFDVHGSTMLSLQKMLPKHVLPIDLVKRISGQMLLALDFVHRSCEIVHTDVKPDNILVSLRDPAAVVEEHLTNTQVVMHRTMSHSSHKPKFIVQSQPIPLDLTKCTEDPTVTFKLADFGVSMFVGKPKYDVIYPPALRPPESLLGAPWGTEADIWALGCIIYELVTGRFMFNPAASEDPKLSPEESHIVLIVTLLGQLPLDLIRSGRWSNRFYDVETGELTRISICDEAMVTLEWLVDHWAPGSLSKEELPGLVDILSRMVRSRPQDRETAYDLLNHPWLQCMTPPHPQPLHSTPSTVPV